MSDIPKSPPPPELTAALLWVAQNLWVPALSGLAWLLFAIGRLIFGDVKKEVAALKSEVAEFKKDYKESSKSREDKLDAIADSLNDLFREFYEIKGEFKAKDRQSK